MVGVVGPARALEPPALLGEGVTFDITESTSVVQSFDNRDFRQNQVSTLSNDHFGFWYNRLNLQASAGSFQLGLRVDNAWFYVSPDPTDIAIELERERRLVSGGQPDPGYFRSKVEEAGTELSNRYLNWAYPAKYYVAYNTRRLELTVGDSYAEFGRGFVLSVRKLDELASDTTIRGVRATLRTQSGPLKLRLTGVLGSANPLRLDESSGRYLGVDDSVTPSWLTLTEAGMPRAVETDFVRDGGRCSRFGTCSYAPDRLIAGQLEARVPGAVLATQASQLLRQSPLSTDVVRSAGEILTVSESLEVPQATRELSLYVEAAVQKLGSGDDARVGAGHALYGSTSLLLAPVQLSLEGKHYRRFFPLLANVSTARAREYSLLAYSAPPTTEAQDNDTEFEQFNTCTSGARIKADADLAGGLDLFGWLGHYLTWAEAYSNERCVIATRYENRIFDAAAGFELTREDRAAHGMVRLGGRVDHSAEPIASPQGEPSRLFYWEANATYELVHPLSESLGIEIVGRHRRREQLVGGPQHPWLEGTQVATLNWARWAFAAGFDYDTSGLVPSTYVNGEVKYRPTPSSSIGLFAGQRAGALRCVGGVCRVFPPFEGLRLDGVVRF